MSKEKEAKDYPDVHLLDSRIVERNIKRGLVQRKDYDKYLKALPDLKDKTKPNE